jgi:hypothetical protein
VTGAYLALYFLDHGARFQRVQAAGASGYEEQRKDNVYTDGLIGNEQKRENGEKNMAAENRSKDGWNGRKET